MDDIKGKLLIGGVDYGFDLITLHPPPSIINFIDLRSECVIKVKSLIITELGQELLDKAMTCEDFSFEPMSEGAYRLTTEFKSLIK